MSEFISLNTSAAGAPDVDLVDQGTDTGDDHSNDEDPAIPTTRDVVIIGSGPAGLTAATYAARANLEPLVIEGVTVGGPPGGQLTLTTDVENYPGFPEGIMGQELIEGMRAQAARFGTSYLTDDVSAIDLSGRPFRITTTSHGEVYANTLIMATGARPRRLEVAGEDRLWGQGVSACATCDGFFFRDKHVVVVGGGDTAMEEATFLTKFANKVTIIHRREELRASQIMQDRAFKNDKIEFIWNVNVTRVLGGDAGVTGVELTDALTGETSELVADGMFLAIGHIPNTQLVADELETDGEGYLVVEQPSTRTRVPGVFAAGDLSDHIYRQAVTAAGMGCKAAMDAERFLAANE